ncbi:nitrogen fixation regulatory protein [Klebsiella aerogenes]|nr:nitrogen fixation regulatory protein [Klebsiella aerogenes]
MMLDNAAPEAIAGALINNIRGCFYHGGTASVAISLTDASARSLRQPSVCRQTGYSLAQLLTRPTPAGQQPDAARDLSGDVAYPAPASAWRGQLINQRRDGSLYLVEIDITPVLSPQGELEHYLAMQRDISVSYTLGSGCATI